MNAEALRNLKKIYFASLAAYASISGAVILYGVIAVWVFKRFGTPEIKFSSLPLQIFFGACAAFQGWLSFRARKNQREKLPAEMTGPAPVEIYTSALLRSSIIGFAVCGTVAVNGLILAFLTGEIFWFWVFAAGTAVCFIFHLPKQSEWENWLEQKLGVLS